MAVTPDTAHVVAVNAASGTTLSELVTCGAGTNGLLVGIATFVNPAAPPTGITYNGVGFPVALGSKSDTAGGVLRNISAWYVPNPATGSPLTLLATNANAQSATAMIAIPLFGVNNSIVPVAGTGATATASTAAACSVSGGGINDLQFGFAWAESATTIVSAGAPQFVVPSTPTMPIQAINGIASFSADFITAGAAGNFGWTVPSSTWVALGVTVFGAASGGGTGVSGSGVSDGAGLSGAGLSGAGLSRSANL